MSPQYIVLAALFCVVIENLLLFRQMKSIVVEGMKLLASRNFSDYAIGTARMSKDTTERKPSDPGYEDAWDREE